MTEHVEVVIELLLIKLVELPYLFVSLDKRQVLTHAFGDTQHCLDVTFFDLRDLLKFYHFDLSGMQGLGCLCSHSLCFSQALVKSLNRVALVIITDSLRKLHVLNL